MNSHLRIARPVLDLKQSVSMYELGLGLKQLGSFKDHQGFDGMMLGQAGMNYHFEFTHCRTHPMKPTPTPEDLLVFYLPDSTEWMEACERMLVAGFKRVSSFNPYWECRGRTFEDPDGYRIVLQNADWVNEEIA